MVLFGINLNKGKCEMKKWFKNISATIGILFLGVALFFVSLPYGVYLEYQIKFNPKQAWAFVTSKAPIEYVIDASEADQGVTGNGKTIKAFVDAIGATRKATVKLLHTSTSTFTDYTLLTAETITDNIALDIDHGARLALTGNITINGPFLHGDGLSQKFSGAGSVSFGSSRTIKAIWFANYSADCGESITGAIASISSVGGKIVLTGKADQTTTINATGITKRIIIEGTGSASSQDVPEILGKLTTPMFDLTGSRYFTFRDLHLSGDNGTTPNIGFLLARDSGVASAGEHKFFNVLIRGFFTLAPVFSYGSEVNAYYSCFFWNAETNGKSFIFSRYNTEGITSAYATIATGSQSNTCLRFYDPDFRLLTGGATAESLYIDGGDDISILGGFIAAVSSRAAIHINTTTGSVNRLTIADMRFEIFGGATRPDYGIYYTGTNTSIFHTFRNLPIDAGTDIIHVAGNLEIQYLTIEDLWDTNSAGTDFYRVKYGRINAISFNYTSRDYTQQCFLTGPASQISLGTGSAYNVVFESDIGGWKTDYGLFHDRGNIDAYDFVVGNFTTDGTWRDFDLSSIVPVGTKTVALHIQLRDDATDSRMSFREKGNAHAVNISVIGTQVANLSTFADLIVQLDGDRKAEYQGSNLAFLTINVAVKGWWK